jgi:hypothetical protein
VGDWANWSGDGGTDYLPEKDSMGEDKADKAMGGQDLPREWEFEFFLVLLEH